MGNYSNFALVLIVTVVLLIPLSLFAWLDWKSEKNIEAVSSHLSQKDIIELKNSTRATYAQILGGIFIIIGTYFAILNINALERQILISQEGQITERFTKAVEQLARGNSTVNLGGVYALERIARDSKKDYWTIMEVLTEYIRDKATCKEDEWHNLPDVEKGRMEVVDREAVDPEDPTPVERDEMRRIPVEEKKPNPISTVVQAILTVLGRRRLDYEKGEERCLNLEKTNLPKAKLNGAKLNRLNLSNAHIDWANLQGVYLEEANLDHIHMVRSNLKNAHLKNASLISAHLEEADMEGADLQKTDLSDAYLIGTNLKGAKLNGAILWGARFGKTRSIGVDPHEFDPGIEFGYGRFTNLKGADLRDAGLWETDLTGCYLDDADLRGVDLSRTAITQDQIEKAIIDGKTTLPKKVITSRKDPGHEFYT